MARYTRKQIVTFISIVYLVFVTAIAGYATSRANRLSVPISDTLTGFATALPVISGILLECGYDLTRRKKRRAHMERGEIQRPPFVIVANFIIFIYSTVVITLLGTHAAPPSDLDCGLRKRWQTLFRLKDASSVRAIQDQYQCCGFANPRDMAWPFPDKLHKPDTCQESFEQVSNFIAAEEHGSTGERRRINYLPDTNRYSDRVQEEDDETTPLSPETRRAIDSGRTQVGTGLPGNVAMDAPATDEWARN
ncbi:hypothetical protein N0V94_004913 [Neodidymelliopsis sp. IMI 364377]|nr:hypothetical protein N0V94_004913 [Neodidymelliopsis sp. IMI 364377]